MFYLDNAATTQLLPEVIEAMTQTLKENYGNPSSINQLGRVAKKKVEWARNCVARSLGAHPKEIVFTSGATESNNAALQFLLEKSGKKHLVVSAIEHPSVFDYAKKLEQAGYRMSVVGVDERGIVNLSELEQVVTAETGVVSIMSVNNETGAIQPIEDVVRIAQTVGAYVHTDAVQAYGQLALDVKQMGVHALSVSGHKIHGPKGVGALYVSSELSFKAVIIGGAQENGMRAGTENVHNIVGFATAVEQLSVAHNQEHCQQLQGLLLEGLTRLNVPFEVNGSLASAHKIAKIVNVYLPNVSSSKLLIQLDLAGVIVSAGSACSAGSLQPSRILLAQFPTQPQRASASIRVSFSQLTSQKDVRALVEKIAQFSV